MIRPDRGAPGTTEHRILRGPRGLEGAHAFADATKKALRQGGAQLLATV